MIKSIITIPIITRAILVLKKNKSLLIMAIAFLILSDILFLFGSSDIRIFIFLTLYVFISFLYKSKHRLTFLLCLVFLAVLFAEFIKSGASEKTEEAAVWLVLFLVVGIIQQWKEISA